MMIAELYGAKDAVGPVWIECEECGSTLINLLPAVKVIVKTCSEHAQYWTGE